MPEGAGAYGSSRQFGSIAAPVSGAGAACAQPEAGSAASIRRAGRADPRTTRVQAHTPGAGLRRASSRQWGAGPAAVGPAPLWLGVEGRGGGQWKVSGTVAEELAPLTGLKVTLTGTFRPRLWLLRTEATPARVSVG